MLTISDVKSDDFAYFNSIEPANTRGAVKGAFRYLTSLANLSNTNIEKWDLEELFQKDGKWITDKPDINRILFTKKAAEPLEEIQLSPKLKEMLEPAFKALFGGSLRNQQRTVRDAENNVQSYAEYLANATKTLIEAKEKLRLMEIASKESSMAGIDEIKRILDTYPLELWDVREQTITFAMKNDTLIRIRDVSNKINRTHNIGRFLILIKTENMTVTMKPFGVVNRFARRNAVHPHVSDDGLRVCWGGFAQDYTNALKKLSLFDLVDLIFRWKDKYAAGDAYVPANHINHHPAFTSYEEGDWLGDILSTKGEKDFVLECAKANLFVAPPLTYADKYVSEMTKETEEYKKGMLRIIRGESWAGVFFDYPKSGYQKKEHETFESPLERRLASPTLESEEESDQDLIEIDQAYFFREYTFARYNHGDYLGTGSRSGERFYLDTVDNQAVTAEMFEYNRGYDVDNVPEHSEDW